VSLLERKSVVEDARAVYVQDAEVDSNSEYSKEKTYPRNYKNVTG
jgi:hypothetical protein